MGRPSSDILLKSFLLACLSDLRKNPWLLVDIFGEPFLETDLLSQALKDSKDSSNAINWFINNKIHVFQANRPDKPEFPCLTIALVGSSEMVANASLGDFASTASFDPVDADQPKVRIYNEFTAIAYDKLTGVITLPDNLSTYQICPNLHLLVESGSGKGYLITKVVDSQNFAIAPGTEFNAQNAYIAPITKAWVSSRGRTRISENYEIGCHATSDTVQTIWLSQILEYCLLKYKFAFLESRGLELSTFTSTDVSFNNRYPGDKVSSRFFRLQFQTEMDWIDSVAPMLGRVAGKINVIDGPKTPDQLWQYNVKNETVDMEGDEGRED